MITIIFNKFNRYGIVIETALQSPGSGCVWDLAMGLLGRPLWPFMYNCVI